MGNEVDAAGARVTPSDRALAQLLDARLVAFSKKARPLPGIRKAQHRQCFVEQLIESDRRVRYVSVIRGRPVSPLRADPTSDSFDPIKAAIVHQKQGHLEEAFWLAFLSVHFGKALTTGWRRVRDVYGALGASTHWTWATTSSNPKSFRRWLAANIAKLEGGGRRFGNHRKYESLDAWAPRGTGDVVESYVNWVAPPRTHQMMVAKALQDATGDPGAAFDELYRSMGAVTSFGRMAKFDYLTMLGKLGLAGIEPASIYMQGATGPLAGAELLFGVNVNASLRRAVVGSWLVQLGADLKVGMQVLEDALCNWQKSPSVVVRYRG